MTLQVPVQNILFPVFQNERQHTVGGKKTFIRLKHDTNLTTSFYIVQFLRIKITCFCKASLLIKWAELYMKHSFDSSYK